MSRPQFFVDHKRGEVNEIRQHLRNPVILRDTAKSREIIKRVIAYMTLGIDVSSLCSDIIMATNTQDPVLKKMCYHYLCTYAKQKSDVAILAINTLQRDTRVDDPMIRGLALRTLCSLRIDNITEYVITPIRKGLNDTSAYVRKTAVVGVAKLYRNAPESVKNTDLVDVLYNTLKDKDTEVVSNVISCLDEVLAKEGGMAINSQIVSHLLNRIRDFNEWGQCSVLSLVAKYTPQNQDEMFAVMNILEDRLQHSNSAVVLAATKVFLHFTKELPEVHTSVVKRLKAPLLTLMTGGCVEMSFVVLNHILLLVKRAPGIFDDQYKSFYCQINDTSAVKGLRLQILTLLANPSNMVDIMNELAEYVTDVDTEIAKAAIHGIGTVALKIEEAANEAIEHLIGFFNYSRMGSEYIPSAAIIVVKDLLRKYPQRYEEVIPSLQKCLSSVEEETGKIAVIWTIGEYGDIIPDAPYFLENLIDKVADEPSHAVRMELLTAAVKLFFKRPPEMQKMMGRLLEACIEDTTKVDVRDRALLYYRLLKADVHECARVVNCPKTAVEGSFAESMELELQEQLFKEFNTLSVIYQVAQEHFTEYVPDEEDDEDEDEEPIEEAPASPRSPDAHGGSGAYEAPGAEAGALGGATQDVASVKSGVDLLQLDDFLSGGPAQGGPAAPTPAAPALQLSPNAVCSPQTFQNKWGSLAVSSTLQVQTSNISSSIDALKQRLQSAHFRELACGEANNSLKLYVFAQDAAAKSLLLIELVVHLGSGLANVTCKAENPALIPGFETIFREILTPSAVSGGSTALDLGGFFN